MKKRQSPDFRSPEVGISKNCVFVPNVEKKAVLQRTYASLATSCFETITLIAVYSQSMEAVTKSINGT